MSAYNFILHSFWSFDGRILIITNNARSSTPFVRTASIESLHLSFFILPFGKEELAQDCPFFLFQGFSEFESSHLVGFRTKAQTN